MKIAICDDEAHIRAQIAGLIAETDTNAQTIEYASVKELASAGEQYDIYFLDIQFPDGDGVELARQIRRADKTAVIVFITGSREYIYDAFDVGAMQYLVKPLDEEHFQSVYAKAMAECAKRHAVQKVVIQTRWATDVLDARDILYAESSLKKVLIHTQLKSIEYYGSLKDLEKLLGDGFYRIHRGYLVNMAYILHYGGDFVTVSGGERLYLSKDRYADFVKTYLQYLRNGGISFV